MLAAAVVVALARRRSDQRSSCAYRTGSRGCKRLRSTVSRTPRSEEFPAISPDGRSVAFTGGCRREAGRSLGAPDRRQARRCQMTHDAADHQPPRWTARFELDSCHFSPAAPGEMRGALWRGVGGRRAAAA